MEPRRSFPILPEGIAMAQYKNILAAIGRTPLNGVRQVWLWPALRARTAMFVLQSNSAGKNRGERQS